MTAAPGKTGRRPRRKRAVYTDHNGKRVMYYVDTGQRYAHLPPISATPTPEIDQEEMARKSQRDPAVLLIDVATSGFKDTDLILDIGAILVDCRPPYNIIEHFTGVVKHDPPALDGAPDFHAPLVQECYYSESATRLPGKEGFLLAGPWTTAAAVLNHDCGFTLRFLEKYMPTFFKALPKCRIDLKGMEMLARARGVPAFQKDAGGGRSYRAADDCISAYEELLWWLETPTTPVSGMVAR